MANELNVDSDGLRIAATVSESAAAELAPAAVEGGPGTHPSQVGAAAIVAAANAVRARQSGRIAGQAGDLRTAGARYESTDSGAADAVTVTV